MIFASEAESGSKSTLTPLTFTGKRDPAILMLNCKSLFIFVCFDVSLVFSGPGMFWLFQDMLDKRVYLGVITVFICRISLNLFCPFGVGFTMFWLSVLAFRGFAMVLEVSNYVALVA